MLWMHIEMAEPEGWPLPNSYSPNVPPSVLSRRDNRSHHVARAETQEGTLAFPVPDRETKLVCSAHLAIAMTSGLDR
ncbi:MAG: hypothetical protein ACYC5Y_16100 [Symbiobacteriia bacterium]